MEWLVSHVLRGHDGTNACVCAMDHRGKCRVVDKQCPSLGHSRAAVMWPVVCCTFYLSPCACQVLFPHYRSFTVNSWYLCVSTQWPSHAAASSRRLRPTTRSGCGKPAPAEGSLRSVRMHIRLDLWSDMCVGTCVLVRVGMCLHVYKGVDMRIDMCTGCLVCVDMCADIGTSICMGVYLKRTCLCMCHPQQTLLYRP